MIRFNVTDEHQIIVPLAFQRGSTDDVPHRDAPELDDRGFRRGQDQSGLGSTDARGAMVGLMLNANVKICVARQDIDDSAPIFITVSDPSKVEVVAPTDGGPLLADGIFQIKGKTSTGAAGKIQARLGSITGPVLAELEPHVFSRLRVQIQPHLVTINSAATAGTEPAIPVDQMIRRIRAIFWPCGIDVIHDTAARPTVHDTIQLTRPDLCEPPGADNWAEFKRVLGLQRTRLALAAGVNDPAINWYIVQELTKNVDSPFGSSVYLYKDRNAIMKMGPLWDFDLAAGNVDYEPLAMTPTGWYVRTQSAWFSELFRDKAFKARVKARWGLLKPQLQAIDAYITAMESRLKNSQVENFRRWPILDTWVWPNAVVLGSHHAEVAYLNDWLQQRIKWMDRNIGK